MSCTPTLSPTCARSVGRCCRLWRWSAGSTRCLRRLTFPPLSRTDGISARLASTTTALISDCGRYFQRNPVSYVLLDAEQASRIDVPQQEQAFTYWLTQHVSPEHVVFDIGAAIGFATMNLARVAKRVVSFEADPHYATSLSRALSMGLFQNVQLLSHVCPASPRARGDGTFFMKGGFGASYAPDESRPMRGTYQCALSTIDALVAGGTVPRADYIRIDTEGTEVDVLSGMLEQLRHTPPKALLVVAHVHACMPYMSACSCIHVACRHERSKHGQSRAGGSIPTVRGACARNAAGKTFRHTKK